MESVEQDKILARELQTIAVMSLGMELMAQLFEHQAANSLANEPKQTSRYKVFKQLGTSIQNIESQLNRITNAIREKYGVGTQADVFDFMLDDANKLMRVVLAWQTAVKDDYDQMAVERAVQELKLGKEDFLPDDVRKFFYPTIIEK